MLAYISFITFVVFGECACLRSIECTLKPYSIAYAYITRRLSQYPLSSLSPEGPDAIDARRMLSSLLPFLADRHSTLIHNNLESAVTDIWGRLMSVSPDKVGCAYLVAYRVVSG